MRYVPVWELRTEYPVVQRALDSGVHIICPRCGEGFIILCPDCVGKPHHVRCRTCNTVVVRKEHAHEFVNLFWVVGHSPKAMGAFFVEHPMTWYDYGCVRVRKGYMVSELLYGRYSS